MYTTLHQALMATGKAENVQAGRMVTRHIWSNAYATGMVYRLYTLDGYNGCAIYRSLAEVEHAVRPYETQAAYRMWQAI